MLFVWFKHQVDVVIGVAELLRGGHRIRQSLRLGRQLPDKVYDLGDLRGGVKCRSPARCRESGRQQRVVDPHDALPEQWMTVEAKLHPGDLVLALGLF